MAIRSKVLQPPTKKVVQSLDIDAGGQHLVAGQNHLTVWNLKTRKLVHEFKVGSGDNVLWARWSPDGSKVAFVDTGNRFRFFELETGDARAVELEDADAGWIDYARDRDRVLVAGRRVQVWDEEKQKVVWVAPGKESKREDPPIGCLSPDGGTAAIVGAEPGKVLLYKVGGKRVQKQLDDGPKSARWIGFDPKMRYVACLEYHAHGFFVWDLKTGKRHLPETFNDEVTVFWSARFDPSGKRLALGTLGGAVWVQKLKDGELVYDEKEHKRRVWDVAFTPDGTQVFSGGDDYTLRFRKLP